MVDQHIFLHTSSTFKGYTFSYRIATHLRMTRPTPLVFLKLPAPFTLVFTWYLNNCDYIEIVSRCKCCMTR